jgi:ATP-dependent helicase/nuclease subunit B
VTEDARQGALGSSGGGGASWPASWPAGVFTIPPTQPFLTTLAHGLLARCRDEPLLLPRITVMLPTRRACRALQAAFLEQAGDDAALLLPRMEPVGDVDEDELILTGDDPGLEPLPSPIGSLERQLRLTRAILKAEAEGAMAPEIAADLASALASLLDQFHTEGLSLQALDGLAPAEFADHWQKTLHFLTILREHWPAILEDIGAIDPARYRDQWLRRKAARLTREQHSDPVIVAGSTGSIPATMALMQSVLELERGAVILPGFDMGLLGAEPGHLPESHPQYQLMRLIAHLVGPSGKIEPWPQPWPQVPWASAVMQQRQQLIRAMTQSADTAESEAGEALAALMPEGLEGVTPVTCAGPEHEALVAALAMREVLEDPAGKRTAMLVTPDRDIARRVAAALARYGISVNDSAGKPLADTPAGNWLRLSARLLNGEFRPRELLTCLKHPFAAAGLEPATCRERVRLLEKLVLRGPRPAPGLDGLRKAIGERERAERHPLQPREAALCRRFVGTLEQCWQPFAEKLAGGRLPLRELVLTHIAFAEALAATPAETGAERIWKGEDGEAAAGFIADLLASARDFPALDAAAYGDFLTALLATRAVRPRRASHPRLSILGLLEARLVHADRVILAGLNEGTWPPEAAADPWLSRPMKRKLSLPTPERRLGQTAHDFAQMLGAEEVFILRAERQGGTLTVPARWWQYLDVALARWKDQGLTERPGPVADMLRRARSYAEWGHQLDAPQGQPQPVTAPAPRPPVELRPRRFSITDVELLMRNPYGFYARHVLKLNRLDAIETDPGAAERGAFIHTALEHFISAFPDRLPEDALQQLLAHGEAAFADIADRPEIHAFWWARFCRVADWFIANEAERRADGWQPLRTEVKANLELESASGSVALRGRADRIDRHKAGGLAVIDYKTGSPPGKQDVYAGLSPQLALEALLAIDGGFEGIEPEPAASLDYWKLSGGREPADLTEYTGDDVPALADHARDGIRALVDLFAAPDMPYLAVPRPRVAPRFDDYAHLARIEEWAPGLIEEQG